MLTVVLAGCKAVGPDYHGPPKADDMPAHYKNADARPRGQWKVAAPADGNSRDGWWVVFHDPELSRLEDAAAANNQNLKLAAARVDESRAQTKVAASDFYPHADFNPAYTRERMSNNGPQEYGALVKPASLGGMGGAAAGGAAASSGPMTLTEQPLSRSYSLFRVPAELNWELDFFGRVRRTYESARAERQAVEADAANMNLLVTANVALTYFDLRAVDEELSVLDRTIQYRRDALGIAQERLTAGLTGELDVEREKSELASNEADRAGVERVRAEMENALATLVGQPASTFRLSRHDWKSTPPRVPAGLPSELLERRPDVAEAERELAAANAQIGVATAAFFPVVRLTGAAGWESATVTDLFNWESHIWQIGPSISLPIFEGGRNKANLEATQARYAQAIARYRQQVLVAFQDVENALADLRTLSVQAEAQERAVEAARRTLELSQRQYGNGAVTFLDVTDAERSLLASERAATQLLGQRMQATVQLIKALGGGWS